MRLSLPAARRWPLLAAALVAPLATPAPAQSDAGSLRFEESLFDFGDVYRGQQVSHAFKFTNAGTGPVIVQGVHAACGCTAVETDKGRKYLPGEAGTIDVKLDTTDFAGPLAKTVTVLTSERLLPDRTLTLKANVKTELEADPPLVDFGDVLSRAGASKTVRVKAVGAFKLEVKDLGFNADVVAAELVKVDGGWDVTVRLKPGLPPGFIKETVLVRNNSTRLRELPIPVRANVKGNIDYAPGYLEFGAIAPQEAARRSVTLRGTTDFDVKGTHAELIVNGRKVDAPDRFLKVDAAPHEKDKKLVSVELKNVGNVAGSVHGKLFIETSDPAQREVAVDFYAFFR